MGHIKSGSKVAHFLPITVCIIIFFIVVLHQEPIAHGFYFTWHSFSIQLLVTVVVIVPLLPPGSPRSTHTLCPLWPRVNDQGDGDVQAPLAVW